jgi:UDP-N-acetylglucosamine 2-epimerase (non-hydrolysing)
MGYREFIKCMQNSHFIISDSGTAQEEPAILNIPVVVPRDFTERPESIEYNNSKMLDLKKVEQYNRIISWAAEGKRSSNQWLGDGTTSEKILNILKEQL